MVVGQPMPFFQPNPGFPAKRIEAGAVHQLTWGAIGFAGIEPDFACVADDFTGGFSELADGLVSR
jgi:hypothetical protein